MAILHLTITGMTCGKCEKIIREGITDEVAGVTEVEIDRPGGKAKISIPDANTNELVTRKEQILKIINSLVNGKFNATIDQGEWKNCIEIQPTLDLAEVLCHLLFVLSYDK